MIEIGERVKLLTPQTEPDVDAGEIGVVMDRYRDSEKGFLFEVEFHPRSEQTEVWLCLTEKDIKKSE